MSTASSADTVRTVTRQEAILANVRSRAADYLEITKPKIAVMALVTVTVGFVLAGESAFAFQLWLQSLFGITLVAASSSALNQYLERHTDRLMDRTANRPLPAGRLMPWEVLAFGILTGVLGVGYLALFVNATTAILSLATLLLYVVVYTPLKRKSTLCTTVGAVPGAMPPVLGWVAAGGALDVRAWTLFGILFLWQFPHFLAIGWLYQKQYTAAGLRMLPAAGQIPRLVGVISLLYALALVPVSLLAGEVALAGMRYSILAALLGLWYAFSAGRFLFEESHENARRLLYCSLLYLPLLLIAMTWDHLQLLS